MQFTGEKPENCLVIYAGDMRLTHKGVRILTVPEASGELLR
jgi:hypothetical protein